MSRGGRGRGRGRGTGRSGIMEALHLPQGESPPPALLQPPPDYPRLERKPLELKPNKDDYYVVTLKRDFRQFMRASPYFIKRKQRVQEGDFCRYTDVFRQSFTEKVGAFQGWEPLWSLFPVELCPVKTKVRKTKPKEGAGGVDWSALEDAKEGDEDVKSEEEEAQDEMVDYDEEEEEEGGDYTANYFDEGGDEYGGDEDDALEDREGPSY